ncbi:MAG: hypothetical protein PHP44_12900 [Kiritimatiellae bacterium]|nr:hypothetical protein [Kiritimatiellia bacterium]
MKQGHKNKKDTLVEMRFLEGVCSRLVDHEDALKALGDLYTRAGLVEKGLQTDLKLVGLCPMDPMVWYNLGCSYALSGQMDHAFESLNQAVDLGYADADWIMEDEDLKALRGDQRFKRLLLRMTDTDRDSRHE